MKTFRARTELKKGFILAGLLSALLLSGLAGCGKQEFAIQSSVESQQGAGNFEIPAKVDILMGWDNTGSMYGVYNQVTSQVPAFLSSLENGGWDFHFAVTPLTVSRVNYITASHHDSNYGSAWTAPYPGAVAGGPGTLSSSMFLPLSQFGSFGFPVYADVSNTDNGREPGLATMVDVLRNRMTGTNFLRDDAMLVLLVLSTGEDTSGVSYCPRPVDGIMVPCPGTYPTDVSSFATQLKALKANNAAKIRMYAAVNQSVRYPSSCLGDPNPRLSARYPALAGALGGGTIDVCQSAISGMLSQMSTQLTSTRLAFRTRYLFISQEPEPSSITVTRYLGGDPNQPVAIPQNSANGWTYEGYQTVYAIDYPVQMNQITGWSIHLNGNSALLGNDTATVTYRPKGSQNTVTQ